MLRHNDDTEDNEGMNMSKDATKEYVVMMRLRYGVMKNKGAKGRILDDFCATTELERKHAIKVLRAKSDPVERAGRKPIFGADVAEILKAIWLAAGQPCSKLMHPVLESYVMSYERSHGMFTKEVRRQVLTVSSSSIDRLLRPVRMSGLRRRRSPMGVAAVKREVPIRAGEWNVSDPGWIEADTVAHCGGSMEGSFAWSLTMTDILTEWTEIRVVWCRGAEGTFVRIREVENELPFPMLGFDSDNGSEFMNWHLHSYFKTRIPAASFTRSRPYQKNDNAHVEQKNGTHVRGLLGHERIDDPECVEALNQAVILWSRWKNLFCPVMKLLSKTRDGHRYKKIYDKPRTPMQRVLECSSVSQNVKRNLRKLLAATDCFTLKQTVDNKLKEVFDAIHKRRQETLAKDIHAPSTSVIHLSPQGMTLLSRKSTRTRHIDQALRPSKTNKRTQRMVS